MSPGRLGGRRRRRRLVREQVQVLELLLLVLQLQPRLRDGRGRLGVDSGGGLCAQAMGRLQSPERSVRRGRARRVELQRRRDRAWRG